MKNREREIEKYQQLIGNSGPAKVEVFQGDMNAFSKNLPSNPLGF